MGRISVESAKTVLEVAEVAFKAVEFSHNHPLHHNNGHRENSGDKNEATKPLDVKEKELEALRSENRRLRDLLEQNIKLLQNISESPCLLEDCPPDLHTRIMDTVESPKFLSQLKTLHKDSVDGIPGIDLQVDEILINVGREEPSLWIWVSDEMVHGNVEEKSEIDNENYIVISQEQVVDGIANFMARCILLNPKAKNLTPEEMQKKLTKALGGMSKFEKLLEIWHAGQIFYLMATWGLALAGLYQSRAVLRVAARGVHATSKLAMKAL
ncbi:hypothetical protein L1987_37046 [Smallanthus sonchifolius]|uniref:Uncharacterized protein n=1 Tax=Smallanthus sonchifolius TaxID=185202 RepID=A0ACB9HF98_9ASTR|nr:hypothetical protein L1987_37046 [Smallanthus sonchifolius]